jgi:hypothetical protein
MRRALTILLLAIFSFSLMAPALLAEDESNLPACCRRHGKHECGMKMVTARPPVSSGPSINSTKRPCPEYPKGAGTWFSSTLFLSRVEVSHGLAAVFTACEQDQTARHNSRRAVGSVQQRGPPSNI